ncbi:uncharacterized protein LOC129909991 [Episyrphus balteatus]|uniref:uncharacterized protein LOC129909991 n=1 Tax=Episyrphus balteatus TaxID=286459 RepID=UPI0024864CDA|nr:uncharacterized protein LOC129909991 [Episyrphus balteatus]
MTVQEKIELFDFLESLANSSYFNFMDIKVTPSIEKHNIDPMDYMHIIYNLTENYLLLSENSIRVHAICDLWLVHSQQILTEWGICYSTNNYLIDELSTSNLLHGKKPPKNPYEDTPKFHQTISMNVFDGDGIYFFTGFKGPIQIYVHGAHEVMNFERRMGLTSIPLECIATFYDITASDDFGKNFVSPKNDGLVGLLPLQLTLFDLFLNRSTTVEQRKCRFPHESNLTHFPIYTRNLCYQECRINLAYKLCKCIPHFYPNRGALKPVCHYKVLKECLSKYTGVFENLNQIKNLSLDIKCNCLENCRSSEILEKIISPMSDSTDLMQKNGIVIMMKSNPKIRYRRQIIFTLTDLLVSIGGTAGFFLGSSVLSAVEIIYYFTFRLLWHCFGLKE